MKPFGWFFELVGHTGDFSAPRDGVFLGTYKKDVSDNVAVDEKTTSFPLYSGLTDAQKKNLTGLSIWHQSKADMLAHRLKTQDSRFVPPPILEALVQDQDFHEAAAKELKELLDEAG